MLKRWIIALRRKPKAARDRVALIGAASFTSLVLLVWLATIPLRFSDTALPSADVFGSLTDTVSSELGELRNILPTPATTTSETIDTAASTSVTAAASSTWGTATTSPSTTVRTVQIATTSASTSNTQPTP